MATQHDTGRSWGLAALFTTSLLALQVAGQSWETQIRDIHKRSNDPSLPAPRSLRPVNKKSDLQKRSLVKEDLLPRDAISMSFGEDHETDGHLYVAETRLTALPKRPLLLLEDLEDLTDSVSCNEDGITLEFFDAEEAANTQAAWEPYGQFVLITSHAERGCNPQGERAPHLIEHVHCDDKSMKIKSKPIDWTETYSRMRVKLAHTTPEEFDRDVVRRDTSDNKTAKGTNGTTIDLASNLDPRLPIKDIPKSQGALQGDLALTCVGCGTTGKITINSEFDVTGDVGEFLDDIGLRKRNDFIGETGFFQIEVTEDLVATLELEMVTTGSISKTFTKEIFSLSQFTPFQIPPFLSFGPIFALDAVLALSGPQLSANFSYGAKVTVPAGATGFLDWTNSTNSSMSGWDKISVTEIPFTVNDVGPTFSFGVNITSQPKLSLGVTVGEGKVGKADAGFSFNLPTIFAQANYMENVTATCTQPGPNDYNFIPAAISVDTGVSAGINVFAEAKSPELPSFLSATFNQQIFSKDFPFPNRCFAIDRADLGKALEETKDVTPQINVTKVEDAFKSSGELPSGVNPTVLATYTNEPVPTDLKAKAAQEAGTSRAIAVASVWAAAAVFGGMLFMA